MLPWFSWTRFKINRMLKKLANMQRQRQHTQQSDEVIQKERALYHKLAAVYARLEGKKNYPFSREAKLACYRAASMLDDVSAQYLLGNTLLDEAKVRAGWEVGGVFASQSNQRTLQQLYEEAHAYLLAAEKVGHIQAKRLRGLCYINGWGVPEDKKLGFDLVMNSIQQENSWDKVPQIFASIGLNTPEFYAALTDYRQKS
jgi:TPR repeat protein